MAERAFDAVVVAASPHALTKVLGLTLAERGVRVATKLGARRVRLLDGAAAAAELARWDEQRGDADLLVLRAGDQIVHLPLARPLLQGTGDRRIAIGPDGAYAGALWVDSALAHEVIAAIATSPAAGDTEIAARWAGDAQPIAHGEIARHPATTPSERIAARALLERLNVKTEEDSPVSKYIYRPLSKPLTRILLRTPLSPNQVSVFVGFLGLAGCLLTAYPSQAALIWGAALVFASGVIDGCDGEIARLKLQYSPIGAWLDTIVDELTSFAYFLAIGYHTYTHYSEGWLASSIALGAACYAATVYGIYYFCVVVLKAGGSQYYVGKLDIVDGGSGLALTPRPKPAPSALGMWIMYVIRRDFVNLAALVLTVFNAYEVIYSGILAGTLVSALIVVPEHIRLRGQLRELARRGAAPRLLPR